MNDSAAPLPPFTPPPAPGSTAPPWTPPPGGPPQKPSRAWLWWLGGGCGCLGLLVLAMIAAGAFYWVAAHRMPMAASTRVVTFSQNSVLPHAGKVTFWARSSHGAPLAGDREAFYQALDQWVFTGYGEQAEKDLGETTRCQTELTVAGAGESGKIKVELCSNTGRLVRIDASFQRDAAGTWQFTFEKYTNCTP